MDNQVDPPLAPQSQPVVAPTEPPKPKSKKWIWVLILVGVGLLLILGTGGVFLIKQLSAPTTTPAPMVEGPIPTVSWNSYSNNHYTFKYPDSVSLKETNERVELNWENNGNFYMGHVTIVDNQEGLSPEEYASTKLCEPATPDNKDYCNKRVASSLGPYGNSGPEGVFVIYNLYENDVQTYLFAKDKVLVQFEFLGDTGTSAEELDHNTIDQILSTFKFTNYPGVPLVPNDSWVQDSL